MSEKKAVIKNADMAEKKQQDAVDCATQALEKYQRRERHRRVHQEGVRQEVHLNVALRRREELRVLRHPRNPDEGARQPPPPSAAKRGAGAAGEDSVFSYSGRIWGIDPWELLLVAEPGRAGFFNLDDAPCLGEGETPGLLTLPPTNPAAARGAGARSGARALTTARLAGRSRCQHAAAIAAAAAVAAAAAAADPPVGRGATRRAVHARGVAALPLPAVVGPGRGSARRGDPGLRQEHGDLRRHVRELLRYFQQPVDDRVHDLPGLFDLDVRLAG
ncbi:MAG: hypothetical protein BJ554DRAFT_7093, partial [Olpidium bornovanus]